MSIFAGIEEVIRNAYLFSRSTQPNEPLPDLSTLRVGYRRALEQYQPYMPVNFSLDPFINSQEQEEALVEAYTERKDNPLDDMNQDSIMSAQPDTEINKSRKQALCRSARQLLCELDEPLAIAFDLVVHSVIFRESAAFSGGRSARGGSTGGAIGLVWVGTIGDSVTVYDMVELLIHELVHHCLFVDELCRPHFDYTLIADQKYWSQSAILNKPRPIDKTVHSIVVSTELLKFRNRSVRPGTTPAPSVHPSDDILLAQTQTACKSLLKLKDLHLVAAPRILSLIEACYSVCNQLSAGGAPEWPTRPLLGTRESYQRPASETLQ